MAQIRSQKSRRLAWYLQIGGFASRLLSSPYPEKLVFMLKGWISCFHAVVGVDWCEKACFGDVLEAISSIVKKCNR